MWFNLRVGDLVPGDASVLGDPSGEAAAPAAEGGQVLLPRHPLHLRHLARVILRLHQSNHQA